MQKEKQKVIYVYEEFTSELPNLLGKLFVSCFKGEEVFSFEYDANWLTSHELNILDPNLEFYAGYQYLNIEKKQFGIFMDSSPDRWGRMLIARRNAIKNINKTLYESDYLLGLDDFSRMGALRFTLEEGGKFLSNEKEFSAPPIASLRDLEYASYQYEKDDVVDDKWVDMLFAPGSSLGGARPKANVIDVDGSLWIAKFPSKHDYFDSGLWEYVVYKLAGMCGLKTVESKLLKFSDRGSTFLVKRFDREHKKRIHYASAMTLLNKTDGESSECSYLDILEFIKSYGGYIDNDSKELWKRIVFSILVHNTDDHLRNHGFLLKNMKWELSPLFDVNANPDGNHLSLSLDGFDNSLDLSLAIDTSKFYGISENEAKKTIDEMRNIIKNNWKKIALENGATTKSIHYFSKVF